MPTFQEQRLEVQKHFAALQRRGVSIRAYLVALVALVVVPALLLGGWLASQSAEQQRALVQSQAEQELREIIALVEREIQDARNILVTLASSPDLPKRNFAAFRQQAMQVAGQLGVQIILRDPKLAAPIINTLRPHTESLPRELPEERRAAEELVLTHGTSVVSNVFLGPLSGHLVAAVMVPVPTAEGPLVLSISIAAQRFTKLLSNVQVPDNWVATIYDRSTTIVARSDRNDEFAGTKVRSESPELLIDGTSITSGVSRDGVAYSWFRRQSVETGWFVSVGVPQSVVNDATRQAFVDYGIAGGVLLAGAMALAYYLGGRISQSVGALGIDRKPTHEEFQVLFEHAPSGVLVADRHGKIALLNAEIERMFGWPRAQLVGQPMTALLPERQVESYMRCRNAAMRTRPVVGLWQDLRGKRRDGSEFPIEIGLNPISTAAGSMMIATIVDITARQEAAERLARTVNERDDLRRRLMQAQEDERLRLAHELHDQTGQSLTAVMLQLKGLEPSIPEHGRDRLRLLRKQLEEMGKTLHRVAWELRPASIDELGLSSALANYIADWGTRTGIETDFHCRDTRLDAVPDQVRTTLYRVVQEGLTNIAKHAANTTTASIVVDRSDGILRLTIEDDGGGFDPASSSESDRRARLGIAGMRERLAMIGGELEVESTPGVGTTVFARVPLEHERLIA